MNSKNPYGGMPGMPPQRISKKKKTKEWGENCVNAIFAKGNMRENNGRTSWERKQVNYNLVNSIIDENDFKHVMDPYGVNNADVGNQPGKLRQMNLIFSKLALMKGEEMMRPFNYQVVAVNGAAITAREEKKKEELLMHAKMKLYRLMGKSMEPQTDPETGQPIEEKELHQIEKFYNFDYVDIVEKNVADLLKWHEHKESLTLKFNEGWEHALISSEDVFYVGISNSQVRVRPVNPINSDFDRNPDEARIEKGDWFREDRSMNAGMIIDEMGEDLSDKQIDDLLEGNIRNQITNGMLPGFAYEKSDFDSSSYGGYSKAGASNQHYIVTHVVWRSMRKIGFFSYIDETGEPQMEVVEEGFRMPDGSAEMGANIEWKWIPEIWEGTKIGDDMYIGVRPLANSNFDPDDPYNVPLPYVGRVLNGTNSTQTSMVDLIKSHQYLHIGLWWKLEQEINKSKGKVTVFDVAMLPKSQGFNMEKWMYMFENANIALVNSHEEGKTGSNTGKNPSMDMMKTLDLTMSQTIGQLIDIMTKLENEIDQMLGITPQRQGQVGAYENTGTARQAQVQSTAITEPWFYMHNEVKKTVLEQVANLCKFAYKGKKVLNYILDDVQRIMMNIDMDEVSMSSYGLFITNSGKENKIFNKVDQLSDIMMQQEKMKASDMIKALRANSVSEIASILEKGEQDFNEQQAQSAQQQQEYEDAKIEREALEKQKDRDHDVTITQMKIQGDLLGKELTGVGFEASSNEGDQFDKIKAAGDNALKQLDISTKQATEREKTQSSERQSNEANRLKEKEIESKERMNKDNNKTALKNKVTGEK
mgnify:CR=1 FL=1|tara:strand:+ start:1085 stop:3532 length:2448 start_codon:yes stop_codon:yes gene_type:complete